IRFRFAPQVTCDRAEPAGKNQQWRPSLQEELRSARRHHRVVAAEHENRVGVRQLMIDVMVVPDFLDQGAYPIVHQDARRNRSTRPARSFKYAASPAATSVVK